MFNLLGVVLVAKVAQHHRCGQDSGAWVCDALPCDIWGRSVYGFEHGRVGPGRVDISGSCQANATSDSAGQIGEDIAEEVVGDDDVVILWAGDHVDHCGIDVVVVHGDLWVFSADFFERTLPDSTCVDQDIGLVYPGELLAALLRTFEGVSHDPGYAVPGVDGHFGADFGVGSLTNHSAIAEVQAFGSFADDHEVNFAWVCQWAGGAWVQLRWAKINGMVELESQWEEQAAFKYAGWDGPWVADGSEEDGVVLFERVKVGVGERFTGGQVTAGAEIVFGGFDVVPQGAQHLEGFWDNLSTDAISSNHSEFHSMNLLVSHYGHIIRWLLYHGHMNHNAVPALRWQNVTKRFTNHTAVNNLTLEIPHGSFYGIVGPNGAGKTTAILMATGLLTPDSGTITMFNHTVWQDTQPGDHLSAKRTYGLLADNLDVFTRLTGSEYLEFLGNLRGMQAADITQRSAELLAALTLDTAADKYIADYSAGMTKKILLAGALLHSPQLLILDEPFEAVDPVSGSIIRQILKQYVEAGGTVVMSSHVMELVEQLCDHVAIINDGQVQAAGTLEAVAQGRPLSERFVELVGGRALAAGSLTWLGQTPPPGAQQ